jgi:glutamine synthetase
LEAERELFEADGVFPGALVDALLVRLREADKAAGDFAEDDAAREELIRRYWHVG